MRAVVFSQYGHVRDVLRLTDLAPLPVPTPNTRQLIVKVDHASLNPVDWKSAEGWLKALQLDLSWPITMGLDFAGTVTSVGQYAQKVFKVGDRVVGNCGPRTTGAVAEYVSVDANQAMVIPDGISTMLASALPVAAMTALEALGPKYGGLKGGERIIINGCCGGVGTFALQLATKHFGASHVVGVCGPDNAALAQRLGASRVIDYHAGAVRTQLAAEPLFDAFIDLVGSDSMVADKLLVPGGRYVTINPGLDTPFSLLKHSFLSTHYCPLLYWWDDAHMRTLFQLILDGKLIVCIDRCVPLVGAVDAYVHLREGHARGKIVVAVHGSTDITDPHAVHVGTADATGTSPTAGGSASAAAGPAPLLSAPAPALPAPAPEADVPLGSVAAAGVAPSAYNPVMASNADTGVAAEVALPEPDHDGVPVQTPAPLPTTEIP